MSDQTRPHDSATRLVAVFPDHAAAVAARAALMDVGVGRDAITVADPEDHRSSLRAEMRGELAAPPFVNKRGGAGFAGVAAIAVVVALVLAVPLAFIDFGSNYAVRYLVVAAIVLFLGLVVSMVVGPGFGVNRPDEQMAAERGVTLQVRPSTTRARDALVALHPIRVDEIDDRNEPVQVIDPGTGEGDGAKAGGLVANLGTDDYSPPEERPGEAGAR